jgi:hypothetical protein
MRGKKSSRVRPPGPAVAGDPFHDFYAGLLAQGMKPEMARLTLARKIAAITLTRWKKAKRFRR